MRRLLGAFRADDAAAERAPAPTFADLEGLVGRARDAGQPVELVVDGDPRELPPGIDLSAYRVVQEALTNALQFATGSRTTVTVRWGADALELEIADRGPGRVPGRLPEGKGQGLIGMRERVTLYGGELTTGPRRGGGFEVRARLPLEPVAEKSAEPVPEGAA
jgi:signal transduction histidine kinase